MTSLVLPAISHQSAMAATVIAGALSLSLPPDDARETVVDAVIALRRNGFRPSAFKSVQVR